MRSFIALLICLLAGAVGVDAQLQPAAVSDNLRPGVRTSSNGTPVIDLTAPDKHGVSRNDFAAFNVEQKGAILNNSFLPGHDALGGLVRHNPHLGWGDYTGLILNEVLGASPSRLNGPLEVFGPRAEVVIANPNGISVNGAQFHNISRLTLAAGAAQYDGKGNLGLSIDAGKLEVGSGGLHVLSVEDVTLLGRNLLLNGPLKAGNLTNQGGLKTLQDIVVSSGAALDNAGTLASRTDAELAAATSLTNSGIWPRARISRSPMPWWPGPTSRPWLAAR